MHTHPYLGRGAAVALFAFFLFLGAGIASAHAATLSVSPTSGNSGSLVTASGYGFRSGEPVAVWFGASRSTTTSSASAYADSNGFFTVPMMVPYDPSGNTSLVAQGTISGITTSTGFYINGSTQTPQGSLSLSAHDGSPGTGLTVYGSAFPRNTSVSIYFGSVLAGTATTDSNGSFQVFILVPNMSTGLVNVTATGAVPTNPPTFYVTNGTTQNTASITVSPASAQQGSQVTVTGSSFLPGEIVTITYGGLSSSVVTNNFGAFTFSFSAPYVGSSQAMNIVARGQTSGRSADALFTGIATLSPAQLSIAPGSGFAGTNVSLSGSGFNPGELVYLTFGSLNSSIVANGSGTFNANFSAPAMNASGNVTLTATGSQSGRSASASFYETVSTQPTPDIQSLQAQIAALQEQIRQLIALITQLLNNRYWR